MNIDVHCKDCLMALGQEYRKVHEWLDEFAMDMRPWQGHRQYRHHQEGIEEIRDMWGSGAAFAARIHIEADMGKSNIPTREQIEKYYGSYEDWQVRTNRKPKSFK